jgi:DUF4097 and DUF4098 domain-containing protein YvlB
MRFIKPILLLTSAATLSGCIVIASPSRADFHTQQTLSLDASQVARLVVEAGAGELIIQGKEGLTEIKVTADIYTDVNNKDNFELSLTTSSSTKANLIAKTNSSSGFWVGDSPHINITVYVPAKMMLSIEDGSGEMKVNNINAAVDIQDGSGDIIVANINGNLNVIDGSGELSIESIIGNVNIEDGSGEMSIISIEGNVAIEDGSGEIYAEQISGNANIEDGSGDLTLRNVTGTVVIHDGSGNIDVKSVGGLKIEDAGSGSLKVKDVEGDFEIDS